VTVGRFPVVVLQPGLGFSAQQYTVLGEDLASRGYVVAGVTPTYSANLTVLHGRAVHGTNAGNPADIGGHTGQGAADADRLLDVWAQDAQFVAATATSLGRTGRLAGRIDQTHVVYLGHSFGGAASLQACSRDHRCAGAIDIDGTQFGSVVDAGLKAPFMILGSQGSCVTGSCPIRSADDLADRATARTLLAASTGRFWCYSITGTRHVNFTDDAVLYLAPPVRNLFPLGSISGSRGLLIQNELIAAFLEVTVRHRAPEALRTAAEHHREVRPLRDTAPQ